MSSEHDFQNDIQVRTDERADGFVFRSELLLAWDLSLSLFLSLTLPLLCKNTLLVWKRLFTLQKRSFLFAIPRNSSSRIMSCVSDAANRPSSWFRSVCHQSPLLLNIPWENKALKIPLQRFKMQFYA
jgi:hypothetical protein